MDSSVTSLGTDSTPALPAHTVVDSVCWVMGTQLTVAQRPPATIAVGGHDVSVEHTRLTLTFSGIDGGTNPTDFWVVPSSGLVVREHETVGVTQGGVRYSEDMDIMLSGLDPMR